MAASSATLNLTAFAVLASALLIGAMPGMGKAKVSPAKALSPEPPMTVYVVRSAQDGCEPNCLQWIAAQGRIVDGSLAQFKKVLRQIGKSDVPVLIHSGGGLSEETMAIGRLIHNKGFDVAVAKTTFTPCAPDDAACRKKAGEPLLRGLPDQKISICASSCTFILAAGKRRFVRAPAFVGVHRGEMILKKIISAYRMIPYRAGDGSIRYRKLVVSQKVVSQKHTDTSERLFDKYGDYFAKMGIAKEIMPLMMATPNDSVHWLTGDELRATRIATHRMSGEQLVRGAAVPGDGWPVPQPPSAPTVARPQDLQADCLDRGVKCPLGVEGGPLPGGRGHSIPVAPVMTGPALPSPAARECALTGAGCSWELTPAAPSKPSQ